MLEEDQRPVAGQRLDPEGHLGELHGGRVEVDPEEAAFGDAALAPGAGLGVGGAGFLVRGAPVRVPSLPGGGAKLRRGLAAVFVHAGPVEGLPQKAHGLDQEVGAAAGGVEHPQAFDLGGGLPLDERPQGVAHQVPHQRPRGVEGAGALAARTWHEVEGVRL